MTCPHLDYREEDAEHTFEVPRAYCTVVESFVEPMRADICTDRFAFDHAEHCEIFREHASETGGDSAATSTGDAADDSTGDSADTSADGTEP